MLIEASGLLAHTQSGPGFAEPLPRPWLPLLHTRVSLSLKIREVLVWACGRQHSRIVLISVSVLRVQLICQSPCLFCQHTAPLLYSTTRLCNSHARPSGRSTAQTPTGLGAHMLCGCASIKVSARLQTEPWQTHARCWRAAASGLRVQGSSATTANQHTISWLHHRMNTKSCSTQPAAALGTLT